MRALLLSLLLLAACAEQSGLSCPAASALLGEYVLSYTARHDAGECIAHPAADAGPVNLTLDDAGPRAATLCSGPAADGGSQLQLLVAGKGGIRRSDLLADGGFHFLSEPVVAQGTACVCDILVAESLDGYLLTGGPFALQPDGGLPPITGLTGAVFDQITSAGSGCVCAMPCTVTLTITGTRL